MAKVNMFHDPVGNTLVVWFDDPATEVEVEETGEEVVLMKNKAGKVIGFEKLNFLPQSEQPVEVAFKTLSM
jgi:uncharacterized protein YuzE